MSIYRVKPIEGSSGFKVHVANSPGRLRVVGIFWTESDAHAWIAADSRLTDQVEDTAANLLVYEE